MQVKENAAPERSPHDGKPYYCIACGLGYAEYLACEDRSCQLETVQQAVLRQQKAA